MKLFKKAREALARLRGDSSTETLVRKPATVEIAGDSDVATAEVVLDPRYKYRRDQRDFERRAAERPLVHASWPPKLGGRGTLNEGRNAQKRKMREARIALRGTGWKRIWRRTKWLRAYQALA